MQLCQPVCHRDDSDEPQLALKQSIGPTKVAQRTARGSLDTCIMRRTRNGAKQPFCADPSPNGILILDASGRYAAVLAARGRPKFSTSPTSNRSEARAEEYKAAAMGVVANFGTWSINEADKTLTQHIEGALFPNAEGADAKRTVSVSGDELKLVTPASVSPRDEAVYRRAK